MSREEEQILVDRLGRLAWRSGRLIGGVRGVAQEGLIPQRAGRKAAERVTAYLRALGQP